MTDKAQPAREALVPSLRASIDPQPDHPAFRRDRLATWLIGLRWVAVIAMAVVVLYATQIGARVPAETGLVLWALVGFLGLFNAVLALLHAERATAPAAMTAQIGVDVAVLAVAIHLTGGLANPFSVFFVFHAIISALLLPAAWARRVAIGVGVFVTLLTALEATGALSPGCLLDAAHRCRAEDPAHLLGSGLAIAVLAIGCALIVITLVDQLERDRDQLANTTKTAAAEAERLAKARSELLVEQDKLQSIVNFMADAVVFAGPDGRVLLYNDAARKLWAETPEAARDLRVCHSNETWEALLEKLRDPKAFEVHPMLEVGDRRYEATFARVCDNNGDLRGAVMVARDVTERIAEQQSRMHRERMATIGRLAAVLAHELNNPLGAIALFSQHALKGIDPEEPLAEYLGTVLRNARLCEKIVRDLLAYARQRPAQRMDVDAEEVLADVHRTVKPHCDRSAIEVSKEIAEGFDEPIKGDPDQLRQVLVNLGLNAIDAMPDGGELCFSLKRAAEGGTVIEVRDTGTGISAEEQEKIFDAFYTTKAEGTGLGLAVASDVIGAHGGRIEVESTPGKGSTFSLLLPPAAAHPQPEDSA